MMLGNEPVIPERRQHTRSEWVGVFTLALLCALGCNSQPSLKQQDLEKVSTQDRAALGAVYDSIGQFVADEDGRVISIEYAPLDFQFRFDDEEAKRIAKLTELQQLTLPLTSEITDRGMEEIASLNKLEILTLNGVEKVTSQGFARLSELSELKGLGLGISGAEDEAMEYVGELQGLVFLDLTGTQITDAGVAQLANLKNLRSLALVSTDVGDDSLAVLAQLPELESLDIRGCNVTDAGLAHLSASPSLKELVAHATQKGGGAITDDGLRHLHGLSTLENVNVAGNKVTEPGATALKVAIPGCQVIRE